MRERERDVTLCADVTDYGLSSASQSLAELMLGVAPCVGCMLK